MMKNFPLMVSRCRMPAALLMFLFIFIPATATRAQNPDSEKRSVIQSVDGYANLSEDMTLSETRAAAFANAKRQAVEMAKTHIKSKTNVEDFILKSDSVLATSEGAVTVLEQKDIGVEDNTRYHVWIKAEVGYGYTPKTPVSLKGEKGKTIDLKTDTVVMDKNAPLTVKVWTPKKRYKDGEYIRVFLQGNRDFYARIVDITSGGDIIQLLPNDYRGINFFEGGKTYKIPDKGDPFDLKVSPPYGEDRIVVYASEVPLGSVVTEPLGRGLRSFRGSAKSLAAKTRGISVVATGKNKSAGAEFYEAAWSLTTGR